MELLLNYEGSVGHPLAIGSIDNFLLELAVHPATLQVYVFGIGLWWVEDSDTPAVAASPAVCPKVHERRRTDSTRCLDLHLSQTEVACCYCCCALVVVRHSLLLQLHTSLGNMVVEYGALAKSNPNRTMLSVRDKQAGSLIDVMFK